MSRRCSTRSKPLDVAPRADDVIDIRDGERINEAGELYVLDDPANLACAHAELALTALDEGAGDELGDNISSASTQAAASSVESIAAWSEPIDGAMGEGDEVDVAVLIGFLSSCTNGGYEL